MKFQPALILSTWFIAGALSAQVAEPAFAPATPAAVVLTPAQTEAILKQLEEIEDKIGQGRSSIFSTALAKFRSAMGSEATALALYLDCYKLENFERKDLKQSDFTDWRDRNEARLKDGDFGKGLMLQLEYLAMSIQVQGITEQKDMGPMVTALQAYLAKAIGAVQSTMKHTASGAVEVKDTPKGGNGRRPMGGGGGQGSQLFGMLKQSVKGSEFSRAYQLDLHLLRKGWEYSPLNIAGAYDAAILPYYLSEKPEEVAAQWDARINAELVLEKAVRSETDYAIFYKEEHPRKLWEKNTYLLANNLNAIGALADMLKIIRENPTHPDAAHWLKDFRERVKASSEPAPGPAPVEKPIGSQ